LAKTFLVSFSAYYDDNQDMKISNGMNQLDALTKKVIDFRDARDWQQFHNAKDVAISLMLEAGEVLEHMQWKSQEELKEYVKTHKHEIGEELVDVLYHVLIMAYDLQINLADSFDKKMAKNELKYPVAKSKGNHRKYTEFQD